MRPWRRLVFWLLTTTLAGCAPSPVVQPATWLDQFRHGGVPVGPDSVQMDLAVIERPIGDRMLNDGLWTYADEQVVAAEHRAVLEDNGFRIAQVGGLPPPELQNLLISEKSCANARRLMVRAGEAKQVSLGAPAAQARFQVPRDGEPETVTLKQAQFTLEVMPTLTADGRTLLRFVPLVLHGQSEQVFRPADDHSGFMLLTERPTERYPSLGWEVTLAPNEYVVIGGRYDLPDTLGHAIFVRSDEAKPVQRLLVIRTGRAAPVEPPSDDGPAFEAPPVASQASFNAVRAVSP